MSRASPYQAFQARCAALWPGRGNSHPIPPQHVVANVANVNDPPRTLRDALLHAARLWAVGWERSSNEPAGRALWSNPDANRYMIRGAAGMMRALERLRRR